MSNHDHRGVSQQTKFYKTLNETTQYFCPSTNMNYLDFHNGQNCLCSFNMERSSMDKMMMGKWDGGVGGNNKNNGNNGNNGSKTNLMNVNSGCGCK